MATANRWPPRSRCRHLGGGSSLHTRLMPVDWRLDEARRLAMPSRPNYDAPKPAILATSPLRRSVRVEALARLLAELACLDHPLQQRRRPVQRLLEFFEHAVRDQLQGVQPDEVGQLQRPHRMREPSD